MVNTSIALNAYGGLDVLGSMLTAGSAFQEDSGDTVKTIGSVVIPANTIGRGVIFNSSIGLGSSTSELTTADLIIKAGASTSEAVVANYDLKGNDNLGVYNYDDDPNFYRRYSIPLTALDSSVENTILVIGSVSTTDSTGDVFMFARDNWALGY